MATITRRDLVLGAITGLAIGARLGAQKKGNPVDLAALVDGNRLQVFNRSVTPVTDGARRGAHLSEAAGDGVAYVPGVEFSNGTIECELRGKDVLQGSFLGIAFHGVDGKTFDAIYFRPFNFRAQDPARHAHAVQYISSPLYDWQALRTTHPGKYEQPLDVPPDPNGWFRARVVVSGPKVSTFVNDATAPSLVVDALSNRTSGLVGLWVGNTSGGDFANLTIAGTD